MKRKSLLKHRGIVINKLNNTSGFSEKKYIIFGAGKTGISFYYYMESIGESDCVVAFCDQKYKTINIIDEKPCLSFENAKKEKVKFIVGINDDNDIYSSVVEMIKNSGAEYVSIQSFMEEYFGIDSKKRIDEYKSVVNKNISYEYYEAKRILSERTRDIEREMDIEYVWFMPEFPFLKMIFGQIKKRKDVFVIEKWSDFVEACALPRYNKYIFVMFMPWVERIARIIPVMRRLFCNASFVFYSYDTKVLRRLDFDYKELFDRVFTFDEDEANKIGVEYYPGLYDEVKVYDKVEKEYDLVWSGKSYGRYSDLLRVYDCAVKSGLRCHFVVVDDGTFEKVERDGIDYVEQLPPENSLKITMSGRCQLELKHDDVSALTTRFYEAITYGMKILTNNTNALRNKYYTEKMMKVYTNIEDVDFDFIKDVGGGHIRMRETIG